jgi:hypothetical protein
MLIKSKYKIKKNVIVRIKGSFYLLKLMDEVSNQYIHT